MIRNFATFFSNLPDDSVESSGDIVVPGGRNVTEAIAEALRSSGYETTGMIQHSSYGWCFDAKGQEGRFWLMVQHPEPWLLTIRDSRKVFTRWFSGPKDFGDFVAKCSTILPSLQVLADVRWFTESEWSNSESQSHEGKQAKAGKRHLADPGKLDPELVPYYDFITRKTILIPKAELSPGTVLVQIEGDPGPVYVDAAQLQQGPYQHPPFEGDKRAAIQSLVIDLADVRPLSFEEWEEGFRRDQNPAYEIAGWVHLAAILKAMSNQHGFGPAAKKECYWILVACFTGSRDTVRDRSAPKLLSDFQIDQAAKYFYEGGYD